MEMKINPIRGSKWYAHQLELIIKSDNTTITEELIPWHSDKVDEHLIATLENIVNELKNHNKTVDEYKEMLKNKITYFDV